MCEPTTIAMGIGLALMAATTVMAMKANSDQAKMAQYANQRQAQAEQVQTAFKEDDREQQTNRLMSKQLAMAGASGIEVTGGAGSIGDLRRDTLLEREKSDGYDEFSTGVKVDSLNYSSYMSDYNANQKNTGLGLQFGANTLMAGSGMLAKATTPTSGYKAQGGDTYANFVAPYGR